MSDFDVSKLPTANELAKLAQDSGIIEARDEYLRDRNAARFDSLLDMDIDIQTPRFLMQEKMRGVEDQANEAIFDAKFDSFVRMPDAEKNDEEGFTLEELPPRLQREMTPVFELYSGPTPGEADGFMSQLDMKAAIDDGVVEFRFAGDEGFKPKVNLDNIPWQKVSAFLAHENGVGETDDIHAGQFVDSVELLLGGEAAGVVFDDLDVALLHELHAELTSVDGLEGASAVELALLLQSEEYSLEELLPRQNEGDRIRIPGQDGPPLVHVPSNGSAPFQYFDEQGTDVYSLAEGSVPQPIDGSGLLPRFMEGGVDVNGVAQSSYAVPLAEEEPSLFSELDIETEEPSLFSELGIETEEPSLFSELGIETEEPADESEPEVVGLQSLL